MLEKTVERKLKRAVEARGGLCLKFVSPNFAGVPDRLCLLPGGEVWFAECKAPGEKLCPLQERRKKQFEALGFEVRVIDSTEVKI
jgi:hypothetical protein